VLVLTFRAGESLYAVDARRVIEVVPRVGLRAVPHAPDYLAGLLDFRGKVVPVVDFRVLVGDAPCREALSTRVVLSEITLHDGRERVIGLAAEQVNRVVKIGAEQIASPAMSLEGATYLGAVAHVGGGLVQLVVADRLLSARMQDALYGEGPVRAAEPS
jgi:chemotaxis-related protein WspB